VRSSFAPVPLLRCNQRLCSTRVGHFTAYHNQRHTVSDEAVEKLGILFSEQLLLAALDLIDRDCGMRKHRLLLSVKITSLTSRVFSSTVIKYISPWGRSHFSVLGMTGSYAVFPSLHQSCSIPFFCTCPAFSYAVLISHSQITVCVRTISKMFHPLCDRWCILSANTSWPL
jgi:hypothetical protein